MAPADPPDAPRVPDPVDAGDAGTDGAGEDGTDDAGRHHLGHLHPPSGLADKLHAARDAVRTAAQEVGAVAATAGHEAGTIGSAVGQKAATLGGAVGQQAVSLGTAAGQQAASLGNEIGHQATSLGSAAGHEAAALGSAAAGVATELAGAVHLEVTVTGLAGARALAGHAVGLHKLLAAEGIHGPREAPSLLYVFPDGLAVRPTDDAPMSSVPLLGLHLLLPYVAMARWAYKAGRVVHANLELAHDDQAVEEALRAWTIDDFAGADPALEVVRVAELSGPVHVYKHFGYVRVALPVSGKPPVHLKSAFPETDAAFRALWDLATHALGAEHVTMDAPADAVAQRVEPPPQ